MFYATSTATSASLFSIFNESNDSALSMYNLPGDEKKSKIKNKLDIILLIF